MDCLLSLQPRDFHRASLPKFSSHLAKGRCLVGFERSKDQYSRGTDWKTQDIHMFLLLRRYLDHSKTHQKKKTHLETSQEVWRYDQTPGLGSWWFWPTARFGVLDVRVLPLITAVSWWCLWRMFRCWLVRRLVWGLEAETISRHLLSYCQRNDDLGWTDHLFSIVIYCRCHETMFRRWTRGPWKQALCPKRKLYLTTTQFQGQVVGFRVGKAKMPIASTYVIICTCF